MTKYCITAPRTVSEGGYPGPYVFLAGGISKCPDWQDIVVNSLLRENGLDELTILNPRRMGFSMSMQGDEAEEQIAWEYNALRLADIVSFWFCKETIQPITLFELGATMERNELAKTKEAQQLVIGVEDGYVRRFDVEQQVRNALGYHFPIYHSLHDVISKLTGDILHYQLNKEWPDDAT